MIEQRCREVESANEKSQPPQFYVKSERPSSDYTMRKYQQLALFIICMISLASFLYYKHEYERLRYTLEYLDTFGNPPAEKNAKAPCQYGMFQKTMTPPANWVQITKDLVVFSAFWDDQSNMVEPSVRVIAVVKKSGAPPIKLQSFLWYENDHELILSFCTFEKVEEREHGLSSEDDYHVVYILCKPKFSKNNPLMFRTNVPYMIQFSIGNSQLSTPIFIHEIERWKTVPGKIALCITPSDKPSNSLRIIEYISYHNLIGVDKFAIYGQLMTPLARKLMDKYGEEMGISYEEKQFTNLAAFPIPALIGRMVIELDCMYRHLDTHESVIVLPMDEYIVPHDRSSIQDILNTLMKIGNKRKAISEFHLTTQRVCIDVEHNKKSILLLSKQVRSLGVHEEKGVAILYPHLLTSPTVGMQNEQHVNKGTMVIYQFVECPSDATHLDTNHLPNSLKFVSLVENSLLFRKWKINQ